MVVGAFLVRCKYLFVSVDFLHIFLNGHLLNQFYLNKFSGLWLSNFPNYPIHSNCLNSNSQQDIPHNTQHK